VSTVDFDDPAVIEACEKAAIYGAYFDRHGREPDDDSKSNIWVVYKRGHGWTEHAAAARATLATLKSLAQQRCSSQAPEER